MFACGGARCASLETRHSRVEEEVLGKAYDARLMRRLVRYLRPYRGMVAVSLVFLLAESIAQVIGPLLTKLAIDHDLTDPPLPAPWPLATWLAADARTGLFQITLLYLGAILVGFAAQFVETYL